MKVSASTVLDAPLERVWAAVQTRRLLDYVAAPLMRFRGRGLPERWSAGEHRVELWLFGLIPLGWQVIGTEFPPSPPGERRLRDNGRGALIRRWDHLITLTDRTDGRSDYRDEVEIDAGPLTPLVGLYARLFYAHRQRRWRRLVDNGFDYAR